MHNLQAPLCTLSFNAVVRPLLKPGVEETDVQFAIRLTEKAGVTVIPVSDFLFASVSKLSLHA